VLFDSLQFGVFLIIVYSIYLLLGRRYILQNRMLLIASYWFYGAWDARFLTLIIISTVIDYFCGKAIFRSNKAFLRKRYLAISICANLLFLGFFKYCNFFVTSFAEFLGIIGIHTNVSTLEIVLPVGISFYTFQTMSYSIDIYRGKIKPCRSFFDFALFVAFFPQLVAGPIERAKTLLPQITQRRVICVETFSNGVYLIVWGLFKKLVIADNLAKIVNLTFARQTDFISSDVILATLCFAFQIYCDFSGYSDIARGVAKLLGIDLMVNFRLPYFAGNPSEFWKRWHISLSTWLRDYLYIPLGGSKSGQKNTYRNLMITMILGGLWHGANWNFVLWGLFHGSILAAHRFYSDSIRCCLPTLSGLTKKLARYSSIALMFVFTLFGWLLFRAESVEQIGEMIKSLGHVEFNAAFVFGIGKLIFLAWPLFVMQLFQYYRNELDFILTIRMPYQIVFYVVIIYGILLWGSFSGPSFIYFQF
jgi:alginate O-acetyltransferase complex protein AlgI